MKIKQLSVILVIGLGVLAAWCSGMIYAKNKGLIPSIKSGLYYRR